MKHSDSLKEIAPALTKAQAEIQAAIKDKTNPAFRSKYADLSSVIDAVKPSLNKHGISFLQGFQDATDGVCVETMLLHLSGEWISTAVTIPVVKHDAQGTGSAITYGKRYTLQSLCGVPSEDDDGNAASAAAPVKKPAESAKPIAQSAFDSLPVEKQKAFADYAADVLSYFEEAKEIAGFDAYKSYKAEMSTDEQAAFWSLFPSNVRSAIKRMGTQKETA
jgi:hypothetical protein